jgi:molybdate transport system substrate-binding protein
MSNDAGGDNRTKAIKVLAAGSLRIAFTEIIEAFQRETGFIVHAEFGPAGLLRERIEQGAPFDLFASANMEHPRRLADIGLTGQVKCFARNRLCIIARRDLGVTAETVLDIALRTDVKLGTSTPGADPGGDYALQFFTLADKVRPGSGAVLTAKALHLVGGPNSPHIPSGTNAASWMIAEGQADMFVSYASNGMIAARDPALSVVALPAPLSPVAQYALTLSVHARETGTALADFILLEFGQRILRECGFQKFE